MKRLTIIFILSVVVVAFFAFPMNAADAKNPVSQGESVGVSIESSAAEKTEISLAESPVWAQMLIVFVVGLFGVMAMVPLLLKGGESGG